MAERKLQDFEGQWRLHRQISPASEPSAKFEGTAVWRPESASMIYREEGTLTLKGQPPIHAEREYRWEEDLSVWFSDGRFFHNVPKEGGRTNHWCDPDTYNVLYEFADWPKFKVTWDVCGPRKDYRSVSLYERC